MADVQSVDPRTGRTVAVVAAETSREQVDQAGRAALAAASALQTMGRLGRAGLLRDMADSLEARRLDIVQMADRETALGEPRLDGELTRACHQLRLFAEVLEEGSYLEAAIDAAGESPTGPRPDLRRMLLPLGPVAVFGASNFPLAFSVPGGDTASALAAGCPVVLKAHGAHPGTSQLCFDIMATAALGAGAPEGSLGLVHGVQAGAHLVQHPAVQAVGFTGSVAGAQALVALIGERLNPIPFYGELSSLNPVVITSGAAADRPEDIGRGLAASATLGAGQFCTKPGLSFIPYGAAGDRVVEAMADVFSGLNAQVLLSERIAGSYGEGTRRMIAAPGVEVVARGHGGLGHGFEGVPLLLSTPAAGLPDEVVEECFGPVTVVARYTDERELLENLDRLPASLTLSLHVGPDDVEVGTAVADALSARSGRLVFNGYPTNVAVSWAQHHGGPWPSTNNAHTSVGTSSIRRFLRPFAWQSAPQASLPAELRDDEVTVPRRINGVLVLPERPRG